MSFKDKDLTKAKPMSSSKDKLPRIEEFYEIIKIKKDHTQGRVLPGYTSYAMYWIPIVGAKTGKEVRIPKPCLNYDPETEEFTDKECPYAKLGVTPQVKYLFNWLDREAQEDFSGKSRANSKEKKSGLKDPSSKSKTPVFVIHGPPSIANKLQKLSELNKGKKNRKKKYAVSDPKEGIDILLAFDGDKKGGDMYDIQRDEKTPLTKEEQEYLVWDLDAYPEAMRNSISVAEAKKDAKELLKVLNKGEIEGESGDDSEDDSEMDDDSKKSSKKKSKAKSKKSSKKKKDESEESEDDASESSEDDSSEESEIDLSEDDASENSEEDSEDDKPKKKSKAKTKKSSKKKKSTKDDSEDDDSEDDASEDDDSEDDKSESSEDDASEDDDSEDESEEEKPKKKSKAKSKAKSKKSSKKKPAKKKSKKDESEDDDSEDDSEDIPFN